MTVKVSTRQEPRLVDDGSGNQQMLMAPANLFDRLTRAPGKQNRGDWQSFVRRLQRPYYRLTKAENDRVAQIAGTSDVVLLDGKTQATWGEADGGYALMPLRDAL